MQSASSVSRCVIPRAVDARIEVFSRVQLALHHFICFPTAADGFRCSLMRVSRWRLVWPTQAAWQLAQSILYTTPLRRCFSTGGFNDGMVVFSFRCFAYISLIFPYISKKWLKLSFFGQKSTKSSKNWTYDPFIGFLLIFKILENFAYFWPIFCHFTENLTENVLPKILPTILPNIYRENYREF